MAGCNEVMTLDPMPGGTGGFGVAARAVQVADGRSLVASARVPHQEDR